MFARKPRSILQVLCELTCCRISRSLLQMGPQSSIRQWFRRLQDIFPALLDFRKSHFDSSTHDTRQLLFGGGCSQCDSCSATNGNPGSCSSCSYYDNGGYCWGNGYSASCSGCSSCYGSYCNSCSTSSCSYNNSALAIGLAVTFSVLAFIGIILCIYFCMRRSRTASLSNASPYATQQEMSTVIPPSGYQQYPQTGAGQYYMGGPSGYGYPPYGPQATGSIPQPYGYYPTPPPGSNMPAGAAPAMGTPVTGYPMGAAAAAGAAPVAGAYCDAAPSAGYPTPGKVQGG
ncbi:hypothetical protein CEUSTIGMA_g7850.t1 [Chlamydomonas eustigma]|uniref:Uncharacterized protein n=1 Tax=Chlamydomonas eustigma TaxID=1157962 RepID=A0A250XBE3_9CHLO|nr:hypothetical protein CEUSTIGMA_g7850.t1 [Chlamydomonas eustigma]|eukprot:GAX80411.1 hypothetical protein CEUSTIGMA_g7850.t1 [Chlamydomonas eustigma]